MGLVRKRVSESRTIDSCETKVLSSRLRLAYQSASGDPRVMLLDAEALRAEALSVEAAAIKQALALSGWLIKPAAARLGMALSTLTSKLRAQHRPLLQEVEAQRQARGYTRGNPSRARRKP